MMHDDPPAVRYPDLESLSSALASSIATTLEQAIGARGRASLIVSGGRSPVMLFEKLRRAVLDWSQVHVALADERWVNPTDPASNERLVRTVLLQENAAAARFVGLKNDADSAENGAPAAWQAMSSVPRPFDVLVLGMGDDGHTASLFPASPKLEEALNVGAAPGCVDMLAPTAPQARLSLNLRALLDSRRIVILITGESKWQTYIAASRPGAAEEMPVRTVLRQAATPAEVIWSP